jgi:pyruvate dehydrogenase E2 component (dihydrolipoamide acetyltransferase)
MEVEAVDEGVLGKILVPDGTQNVKVNDPIAVLVAAGETASDTPKPAPKQEAGEVASPIQTKAAPPPTSITAPAPVANGHDHDDRVFASPLARRMAKQAGIDLASLTGSGPNGRIVRADIEAAQGRPVAAPQAAAPAPAPAPSAPAPRPPAPAITAPHQAVPFNNIRKITARRLAEAKQTIPHFYVSIDIELDALLKLRQDLNAKSPKDGPGAFKLSVNDLLIKAAAVTLRRVPNVNASYTDDALILYDDVDISVAVSIPDGLITPIIRQADRKGLAAISNEAKSLIARARAGKLKPQEFQGGSFSISNMGMYGVSEFSAIINPPQAAILAVAAGQQRAIVRAGALAIATVMTVTLSVDHRVIDGALAAEWVSVFKGVVEDPLSLML